MNFLSATLILVLTLVHFSVYGVINCNEINHKTQRVIRRHTAIRLWDRLFPAIAVEGRPGEGRIGDIIPDLKPSELVVSIEAGHVSILFRNGRYDGSVIDPLSIFMSGNAKIRHTKIPSARGVIIRLGNLSADVQTKLAAFFETEGREFALTCATGACSVLSRSGIRILGSIFPALNGNAMLRRLTFSPLENPDGTPIQRDIFLYDVDSIESHIKFDRLITLVYLIPESVAALLLYFLV
ncbi:MAG: hypothetical protein C5B49_16170 [Bdellovibrio sp.]|nr:MAG: hypothetical protein C5B49_16170 [Bdellovibrio sp.]